MKTHYVLDPWTRTFCSVLHGEKLLTLNLGHPLLIDVFIILNCIDFNIVHPSN